MELSPQETATIASAVDANARATFCMVSSWVAVQLSERANRLGAASLSTEMFLGARRTLELVPLLIVIVASCILPSACSKAACTDDARVGLGISVRDARTGAPLCDSVVVAFDGTYREDLSNYGVTFAPCTYFGATERAGTYRLEITHSAYLPKQVGNLIVLKANPDDCHISNGASLTVDLEPDPDTPRDLDASAE